MPVSSIKLLKQSLGDGSDPPFRRCVLPTARPVPSLGRARASPRSGAAPRPRCAATAAARGPRRLLHRALVWQSRITLSPRNKCLVKCLLFTI